MQSKIASSIPLALPANYPLVGLGVSALFILNVSTALPLGLS
jgi:hypothetical protein